MESANLLSFYSFIQKYRRDLIKNFGGGPIIELDDDVITFKWSRSQPLTDLVTSLVIFTDVNIHPIPEPEMRIAYLMRDGLFITTLSSLSSMYKNSTTPLIPMTVTNHVMKLTNMLLEMILYKKSDRVLSTSDNKLPFYVNGGQLSCVYNNSFDKMHYKKSSTYSKRGVGLMQNALITERYYDSMKPGNLMKSVKTDVNYCRRVAVVEKIVNRFLPFMNIDSLSQVINLLYSRLTAGKMTIDGEKRIPTAALDADMIYLMNQLKTAMRSRCTTKGVELLPIDCTCHMKCRGPTYGKKALNKLMDDLEQTTYATRICGLCRLSHCVENTTSAKPKKYINPMSPAISSCSFDGCTTSFIAPTHFKTQLEDGGTAYEVAHRAFITNSLAVKETSNNKMTSSATGRFHTTCVTGSRTCMKGVIKTLKNGQQSNCSTQQLWRCDGCKNINPLNLNQHMFFLEEVHKSSCIGLIYKRLRMNHLIEDIKKLAPTMCLPCRMACMCRHSQHGLMNTQRMILIQKMKGVSSGFRISIGLGEVMKQQRVLTALQYYFKNTTKEWSFQEV